MRRVVPAVRRSQSPPSAIGSPAPISSPELGVWGLGFGEDPEMVGIQSARDRRDLEDEFVSSPEPTSTVPAVARSLSDSGIPSSRVVGSPDAFTHVYGERAGASMASPGTSELAAHQLNVTASPNGSPSTMRAAPQVMRAESVPASPASPSAIRAASVPATRTASPPAMRAESLPATRASSPSAIREAPAMESVSGSPMSARSGPPRPTRVNWTVWSPMVAEELAESSPGIWRSASPPTPSAPQAARYASGLGERAERAAEVAADQESRRNLDEVFETVAATSNIPVQAPSSAASHPIGTSPPQAVSSPTRPQVETGSWRQVSIQHHSHSRLSQSVSNEDRMYCKKNEKGNYRIMRGNTEIEDLLYLNGEHVYEVGPVKVYNGHVLKRLNAETNEAEEIKFKIELPTLCPGVFKCDTKRENNGDMIPRNGFVFNWNPSEIYENELKRPWNDELKGMWNDFVDMARVTIVNDASPPLLLKDVLKPGVTNTFNAMYTANSTQVPGTFNLRDTNLKELFDGKMNDLLTCKANEDENDYAFKLNKNGWTAYILLILFVIHSLFMVYVVPVLIPTSLLCFMKKSKKSTRKFWFASYAYLFAWVIVFIALLSVTVSPRTEEFRLYHGPNEVSETYHYVTRGEEERSISHMQTQIKVFQGSVSDVRQAITILRPPAPTKTEYDLLGNVLKFMALFTQFHGFGELMTKVVGPVAWRVNPTGFIAFGVGLGMMYLAFVILSFTCCCVCCSPNLKYSGKSNRNKVGGAMRGGLGRRSYIVNV